MYGGGGYDGRAVGYNGQQWQQGPQRVARSGSMGAEGGPQDTQNLLLQAAQRLQEGKEKSGPDGVQASPQPSPNAG